MKQIFALFLLLVLFACNDQNQSVIGPGPSPSPSEEPKVFSTGLIKHPKRHYGVMHFIPKKMFGVEASAPDAFSWEDKGFATPVRDQANCGSCWAFGGTQTIEMGYKIFAHKDIDFSEQDLVGKLFYGCNGGYFTGDYQVSHGQLAEKDCPYTATNKKCASTPIAGKGVSWGLVGKPGRGPSDEELQNAIMTYGPVAATVCANGSFMNYKGGLASMGPACGTNHIITLTGWKTANGKVYFKIKNSWGLKWGEQGYGWFQRGSYNLAEEASWLAVEAVPCQPPKIKLPKEITVEAGDEIVVAVKKIDGVSYTWFENNAQIGSGNELTIVPTMDTVYHVVAKNQCGDAEIQMLVTINK